MIHSDPLYVSLPFAYTQPSALAALAILHGLTPPPVERASVLELACASGGNVIPLAYRFPDAKFAALDIVEEEIAIAKTNGDALGLANLTLEVGDVVEFADRRDGVQFDYILCHGLISWAPPPVREAVFKICAEKLSDHGLAVVSFNVLPGWRVKQLVRDIVSRSVDQTAPPLERVKQAQTLLKRLAPKVTNSAFGIVIQQNADRLADPDPSYLFSEFLSSTNDAFFFEDIVAGAQRNGLHYVTEGELSLAAPETVAPGAASLVLELSDGDPLAAQSWLDRISGRVFRRAMFAKRPAREKPSNAAMADLHVSALLEPQADSKLGFKLETGHMVNAPNHQIAMGLARIGAAYPSSVPVAELARENGEAITNAILRLAQTGAARLSSTPFSAGRQDDPYPRAFEVARLEAKRGQSWVTTLQHRPYYGSPETLAMLAVLDGKPDRATLTAIF